LADAKKIHTSVVFDLSYTGRRISRALSLMDEHQDRAIAQLVLAQTKGVQFAVNRQDHPLVDAQAALQIAERMAEQGRLKAARSNLQVANYHLGLYRGLISKEDAKQVIDLEKQITELQNNLDQDKTSAMIRGFWDRVTGWFTRGPGETSKSSDA